MWERVQGWERFGAETTTNIKEMRAYLHLPTMEYRRNVPIDRAHILDIMLGWVPRDFNTSNYHVNYQGRPQHEWTPLYYLDAGGEPIDPATFSKDEYTPYDLWHFPGWISSPPGREQVTGVDPLSQNQYSGKRPYSWSIEASTVTGNFIKRFRTIVLSMLKVFKLAWDNDLPVPCPNPPEPVPSGNSELFLGDLFHDSSEDEDWIECQGSVLQ